MDRQLRAVILTAVTLAANGLFALVLWWRWNHEAVRVYDFAPQSYGLCYLLLLPFSLWGLWETLKERNR